ncbi:hypothetical protein C479_07913 [Halovivax asiaticus JCM 14624]|uniref:Uncharacterized protein n=1 Tax=Halovivax asiaticus JCM 14624 TaxID=1227490 RepID=M0BIN6_9EURY|nr:hypothetical protein [Halovivax asiaticus]ELZ10720.1 hypothetical protein C479_07913 [Halovivax asiaticus JCM 14624]
MIDFASLSPTAQALALVGVILVEALVLYGGYGLLERVVAPPLVRRITES